MFDIYEEIVRIQNAGQRAALATIVDVVGSSPAALTSKMLIRQDGSTLGTVGGGCLENDVRLAALDVMETGEPLLKSFTLNRETAGDEGLVCGGRVQVYIEPLLAPRLYLFGAGHVSGAICRLARNCGFYVVVMDDREKYANRGYFPEANEVVVKPFEELLATLRVPRDSYLAIVTRGHEYDGDCLAWALKQDVRYIGMIGSAAKRSHVYQRLRTLGFSDADFERVACPIGLDIGAETREEIAVSVVAQLVRHRRVSSKK